MEYPVFCNHAMEDIFMCGVDLSMLGPWMVIGGITVSIVVWLFADVL